MKKTLAIILALMMVLSLFAGCGDKAPASTPGSNAAADKPADTKDDNKPADTKDEDKSADDGKVYELIFSMHDAETAVTSEYIKTWAKTVEEASGGRIKFVFFFSGAIANAMEGMDAVENGSCDLVWSAPALFAGRFTASLCASLPMIGYPNNADGGEIIWRMYNEHDYVKNEWDGLKLISIHPNGSSVLITKDKIESIDDFKNLRIRSTTASVVAFLEALGAAPISFSVTETFENIEKGIADGTFADWNFATWNRLYDICDYATYNEISTAFGCIVMNPDSYAKLPADLQAIIDEYSGVYASRLGGEMMGAATEGLIQENINGGQTVYNLPDDVVAVMDTAKEAGLQAWYDEVAAAGYDGPAIWADLSKIMAEMGY